MTVAHAHLAPVELDDPTDAGPADAGAPSGRLPAWVRRHAGWVAGASAVLVLTLVGVQSSLDGSEVRVRDGHGQPRTAIDPVSVHT